MLSCEPEPRLYRADFIAACLENANNDALAWYETLKAVVASSVAPQAETTDRTQDYPTAVVDALRQIGTFGVFIPTEHGGQGYDSALASLAVETVAASCASTAAIMLFHYQVVKRVMDFGSASWRSGDLNCLANGSWLGSSAWTELGAGTNKGSLSTKLRKISGELRVTGAKHFCTGLEGASVIHVLLDAGDGAAVAPTFVRIPVRQPGVDVSEIYPLLGLRGSSTGTVRLTDVAVQPDWIIGAIGQGTSLMRANHEVLINAGTIALGVAGAAIESARLGVLGRTRGSRDTSGYQATRFKLADMETRLAQAYGLAAQAIRAVRGGSRALNTMCLKVKLAASEAAVEVAGAALRLAGARGFHEGWPHARFLRDAYATVLMGPANEVIREQLAAIALADPQIEWSYGPGVREKVS